MARRSESIQHRAWPTGRTQYTAIPVISSGTIELGLPGSISAQVLPEGNVGCGILAISYEEAPEAGPRPGSEGSPHRSAAGGPSRQASGRLLWVAGGLGQGLPVAHAAGQLLAPRGLEEARLVWAAVELGPTLSEVLPVLIVTLEFADAEETLHPQVVVDAAVPSLQAPVPQEGLSVPGVQVRDAEGGHGCPPPF